MKSDVSPQTTPIWASICTPVAPSLLISSGHSPRLGGAQFSFGGAQAVIWGGTAPVCPPWRRVWINEALRVRNLSLAESAIKTKG